jgi:hypothetical protein
MNIKEFIINTIQEMGEDNEMQFVTEINSSYPLLRNGLKHTRHFKIAYKTSEELDKILKEFEVAL